MLKISHGFDAGAIETIAADRADDIRVNIRADSHAEPHGLIEPVQRRQREPAADLPPEHDQGHSVEVGQRNQRKQPIRLPSRQARRLL